MAFTVGELVVIGTILAVATSSMQRLGLNIGSLLVGAGIGGWVSLTLLSTSWLQGRNEFMDAPLYCDLPVKRSQSVLMPLPRVFEPAEVATTWTVLVNSGHKVYFATENGKRNAANKHGCLL